jgi:hypothetical protein
MGGLVVKKVSVFMANYTDIQAIINAYNDRSYKNIVANARGIVFLGTPHRGADLVALLNALLTVSFSHPIFVDQLRANSELIQEINEAFRDRSESLELISYYESEAMHGAEVFLHIQF